MDMIFLSRRKTQRSGAVAVFRLSGCDQDAEWRGNERGTYFYFPGYLYPERYGKRNLDRGRGTRTDRSYRDEIQNGKIREDPIL